ncbi:2OG-Fe(II) oxygenase [Kordiimonas sp. SCSIO 12603]|uniref:prolyl hydroxylase family protein n=1 Tax=Kordiimonas sp. SCSIO 12603 TaxID=2829596 RepID=UPI0021044710|nr:2OG-Fe(II) oxygenase [Kordiimonas sp. SCSIO 12603]UTW60065.1 2OG-Fe(II) oxygenase [Kordiimonas sp. SCSIO 12603]
MQRAIIDLSVEPRVYSVDSFLSSMECKHLISSANGAGMKRAKVSGVDEGQVSQARTNSVCWLDHSHDLGTKRIASRIAGLLGLPINYAERFQVIHYEKGQEYRAHFDAFNPQEPSAVRNMKNWGQRLITVLGYLNDVQKGGETEFPKLDIKVPAERGKLLVFHNCTPGTKTRHPKSLHAACPVLEGEKWAFNLWFREGPYQHNADS